MTTALAVIRSSQPPANLTEAEEWCGAIETWSDTCTEIPALKDANNRLAAMDEYLSRTAIDGRKRIAAAMRRLEVRIGALLPSAERTNGRPLDHDLKVLTHDDRHDFRKMAAHPEVVDRVIEESTDAEPPSRRKVLQALATPRRTPLIDEMRRSVQALNTAASTMDRLSNDDRFSSNRAELARQFRGDVVRIADALAGVATRMEGK